MDETDPEFFASIRRQLLAIAPDNIKGLDKVHLRAMAIEALEVCEMQARQLMSDDAERDPVFSARLQLILERFSWPHYEET